jgi:hypothetical protein
MLPQVVRTRNPGLNNLLDMLGGEFCDPADWEKHLPWWRWSFTRKQQSGDVSIARYAINQCSGGWSVV